MNCDYSKRKTGRFLAKVRRVEAFSLIEVVMAIGITAFAAFAIAGLIPVGMSSFRQTKNVSIASDISRQVFSDLANTTFATLIQSQPSGATGWHLPAPNSTTNSSGYSNGTGSTNFVRNFDDQGSELASSAASNSSGLPSTTIYQVNVRVAYANFLQSPSSGTPLQNNNLVTVTIQIAFNPGHLPLDLDTATQSLWTGTSNGTTQVQIFTYQTMVAGDPTSSS